MDDTEIKGLPQFLRALDDIQKQLPKQLKDASQDIARDLIGAARGRASGVYGNQAAAGFGVANDPEGARVTNSSPIFYGMEFGGGSRPETRQFPPYQGQRGYFFYPAARANAGAFQKVWEAAIDQATKSWNHKE